MIAAIYFAFVLWRPEHGAEVRKKYWKETVIVIKWIAVHKYCNVDLHLYNLIFVLVAYEAVSHWFSQQKEDWKGGGGEKLEQVFLFCFVLLTIVGTIYILSSAVILQCLKDFYQEYSQKNNLFLEPIILKTPKAPFQTPHLWQTWWHKLCPRPHICVTDCNSTIHNW